MRAGLGGLRDALGVRGFLLIDECQRRAHQRRDEEQRCHRNRPPRPPEVPPGIAFAAFRFERALVGGFLFLPCPPRIPAGADHAREYVMGQFDATQVQPFLNVQETTVHQPGNRVGGRALLREELVGALQGDVLTEAGVCQQVVLDEVADRWVLVCEAAFVKVA